MSKHTGFLPLLISIIGHITVSPIILIIKLSNDVVRFFIAIHLYFKYHGEIKLANGPDGMWVNLPGKSQNSISFQKLEEKIDLERVIETYEKAIRARDKKGRRLNDKFEHILISKMGYACWKRAADFNIRNHIRFVDNADHVCNKEDLKAMLPALSEDMLDSKPQWEVILVPRYKDESDARETMFLITRYNHAYCDGLSMNLFIKTYLSTNFTHFLDPLESLFPTWQMLLMYINGLIYSPYALFYLLQQCRMKHWPVPKPLSKTMATTERNSTWSSEINLDNIRTIRKAVNGTTLTSTIENAFISAAKQILPRGRIPKEWFVSELAAILPYPNQKPMNRFTAFPYTIDSSEEDFLRLEQSNAAALDSKFGPILGFVFLALKDLGRMPTFFHPMCLALMRSSILISNLPTSKSKFKGIHGVDVTQFFVVPPQPFDTGIIISNVSYANGAIVSVTANTDCLKKEELEDIVDKIPNIIGTWAKEAENLMAKETIWKSK